MQGLRILCFLELHSASRLWTKQCPSMISAWPALKITGREVALPGPVYREVIYSMLDVVDVNRSILPQVCPPAAMSTCSVEIKNNRADLTRRLPVLIPPHHV